MKKKKKAILILQMQMVWLKLQMIWLKFMMIKNKLMLAYTFFPITLLTTIFSTIYTYFMVRKFGEASLLLAEVKRVVEGFNGERDDLLNIEGCSDLEANLKMKHRILISWYSFVTNQINSFLLSTSIYYMLYLWLR
jgi:hypothetical protein